MTTIKTTCDHCGDVELRPTDLALELDPYPRKPGAEFTWSDPREAEAAARANPFAVLKKLKDEG